MLLKELALFESSYPGNIGAMEVMKFYQSADENEREQLDNLLRQKEFDDAWELIQYVTNVRLHSRPK